MVAPKTLNSNVSTSVGDFKFVEKCFLSSVFFLFSSWQKCNHNHIIGFVYDFFMSHCHFVTSYNIDSSN